MTKKNSLFKNVFLVMFSAILFALSIFSLFSFTNKDSKVFADTTSSNFYGSSFFVPVDFKSYQPAQYTWSNKSWTGLTSFFGASVWSDGLNYYYSNGNDQYVLDVSTSTWSTNSWNGYSNINGGSNVWSIGTTYYYSNGNNQYVLDVSTSTWSTKSWNGLTTFAGSYVWSDGVNYYYSNGNNQYVLDVSTSTWSTKTWNGLTSFNGNYVWSDGLNYYYSNSRTQYVLDVSTSTWSTKTWNGLTSFDGGNVWSDGVNYYFSSGSVQYSFDFLNSTLYPIQWLQGSSFSGNNVWTDGTYYYYSSSNNQRFYNPNYLWRSVNQIGGDGGYSFSHTFASISIRFLGNQDNSFNLYISAVLYFPHNSNFLYAVTNRVSTSVFTDFNNYSDYVVYSTTNYNFDLNMPFSYLNYAGVPTIAYFTVHVNSTGDVAVTDANFSRVTFSSAVDNYDDSANNNYNDKMVVNGLMYSNSLNQNVIFSFDNVIRSQTPIFYYADDVTILNDILAFNSDGRQDDEYYYRFNERTYFIGSDSTSLDYNQGYNAGYDAGYSTGFDLGNAQGTSTAASQYNYGYSAGYSAGVEAAHNYTFLGLISAVVDAPISYFRSLFNFNLLGVNLVSFITGLFTLAIIITIIKKVI